MSPPSPQVLTQAKKRIVELIQNEQANRTIRDKYICHLTQEDLREMADLQKQMTIKIDLNMDDQDPSISLEGLTRDVSSAESVIRSVC